MRFTHVLGMTAGVFAGLLLRTLAPPPPPPHINPEGPTYKPQNRAVGAFKSTSSKPVFIQSSTRVQKNFGTCVAFRVCIEPLGLSDLGCRGLGLGLGVKV